VPRAQALLKTKSERYNHELIFYDHSQQDLPGIQRLALARTMPFAIFALVLLVAVLVLVVYFAVRRWL
jgi:hypothetical protein